MEKQIFDAVLSDIAARCSSSVSGDLKSGYTIHAGLKMQISFKNGALATDMLGSVTSIIALEGCSNSLLCLKGERRHIKYVQLSDITLISVTELENLSSSATDVHEGTGAGFLR